MNKFFVIIIYLLLFRLILSLTFIWVGPLYSSAGMQRKLMIFYSPSPLWDKLRGDFKTFNLILREVGFSKLRYFIIYFILSEGKKCFIGRMFLTAITLELWDWDWTRQPLSRLITLLYIHCRLPWLFNRNEIQLSHQNGCITITILILNCLQNKTGK